MYRFELLTNKQTKKLMSFCMCEYYFVAIECPFCPPSDVYGNGCYTYVCMREREKEREDGSPSRPHTHTQISLYKYDIRKSNDVCTENLIWMWSVFFFFFSFFLFFFFKIFSSSNDIVNDVK